MGKVIGIAAMVVGAVALIATGAGFIFGAAAVTAALGGVSAAMLTTAAAVLSIGASLLSPRPKPPGMSDASLDRLNVSLDPRTPRKAVFGNTAAATDLRDNEIIKIAGTNDDYHVHRFIVLGGHTFTSIDEIWFEDEKVWAGGSNVAGTEAHDYLHVQTRLAGNAANAINISARMGDKRRFTGCGYVYFRFKLNSKSPFSSAIPSRITIKVKGMPVYDPRKDSTVTGGSGSQRADDQSTWTYDSGGNLQGENPACQMLTWLLGWRIQNPTTLAWKLSVGKGIPADRLDLAAWITAANACDEAVSLQAGGTEKRYVTGGVVSEGDDPLQAVDRWKAAMNATLDDVDGQIRLQVLVNDLGAPVADFTEKDIVNQFSWKPFENLTGNYNIIRGSFVSPDNKALFQMIEYPEVKIASRDGIDRIETINYDFVQNPRQAQRLSKTRLQRAQYPGLFQAEWQITGWKVQKGDVVRQTFGPLGFLNKLFRVVEMEHRADGKVPMTLREEHADIYGWLSSEEKAVNYADPVGYGTIQTPWQKMMQGQWVPPVAAVTDGNMLADAQFGAASWTLTGVTRVGGEAAGDFNYAARSPYVAQIALGQGATAIAESVERVKVSPNQMYWQRFYVAKEDGAAGTAQVNLVSKFRNLAGAQVGAFNSSILLSAMPSDSSYTVLLVGLAAPAGAETLDFRIEVPVNAATGSIRIDMPLIDDVEPGADIDKTITGPTLEQFVHSAAGVAESGQFPRDLTFKLIQAGVVVTSGLTWSYRVIEGTVNGNASGGGWIAMSGTGTGILTVNSLGLTNNKVEVKAVMTNGQTIIGTPTVLQKTYLPAVGGGGGGTANTTDAQNSGFTAINSTSFVPVSEELTITVGSSSTTATTQVILDFYRASAGTSTVECKVQAFIGGVWTDQGATASASSDRSIANPPGGEDPWNEPASFNFSRGHSGLTSGASFKTRIVARLTSGSVSHSVLGQVSLS